MQAKYKQRAEFDHGVASNVKPLDIALLVALKLRNAVFLHFERFLLDKRDQDCLEHFINIVLFILEQFR
jgi:hypothetical protein